MQNNTKKRLPLYSDIVTKESYVDMGYSKEEELATDRLEMITIELKKFKKKNPDANNVLNQWLWLILGEEGKIEMASKNNKELKKAVEIIDEMSMDPKEWELYRSRQMAIMNYNIGMENAKKEGEAIGEKRGEKNAKIETARKLLAMGLDIDKIIEATELTKDELEKIIKV